MSRILFENEYVIVEPSFEEVSPHKHSFYHIFFLGRGEDLDEIFVTGSGMPHTMPNGGECKLFLMIDPTSDLADHLKNHVLSEGVPKRMKVEKTLKYSKSFDDDTIKSVVADWLVENGYRTEKSETEDVEDYRVVKLIREIRDYRHLEKKIDAIAAEYHLSESRLSHAFKESVGISLKGYLMIARMKYAYKLVLEGKSKTFASFEAGFAGPAHLAYVCKKQMGISITDVLKR